MINLLIQCIYIADFEIHLYLSFDFESAAPVNAVTYFILINLSVNIEDHFSCRSESVWEFLNSG